MTLWQLFNSWGVFPHGIFRRKKFSKAAPIFVAFFAVLHQTLRGGFALFLQLPQLLHVGHVLFIHLKINRGNRSGTISLKNSSLPPFVTQIRIWSWKMRRIMNFEAMNSSIKHFKKKKHGFPHPSHRPCQNCSPFSALPGALTSAPAALDVRSEQNSRVKKDTNFTVAVGKEGKFPSKAKQILAKT